jgi:hypothetical protein
MKETICERRNPGDVGIEIAHPGTRRSLPSLTARL